MTMRDNTVTWQELQEKVDARIRNKKGEYYPGSPTNTLRVMRTLFDVIEEEMAKGKIVHIPGFGFFDSRNYSERQGFNFATHEYMKIPAHSSAHFRQSKKLKRALNQ